MEPRGEVERALDTLSSRTTFGLGFIVVFCIAVTGALVWFGMTQGEQSSQLKAVATETHSALCTLKQDLQSRYDANLKLLKDHPEDPIVVYGLTIPRDTLVTNAAGQKSTLGALQILDCR